MLCLLDSFSHYEMTDIKVHPNAYKSTFYEFKNMQTFLLIAVIKEFDI